MANGIDLDQTVPVNDSVDLDLDETAENGKYWRPWSDYWDWQIVFTLIRLFRMAISVDPDQTAENGK